MEFFRFLNSKKALTIQEIELWLLKHSDEYRTIKKYWNCDYCPTEKNLPCICKNPSEEWIFLTLYNSLDEITALHKLESYAKEQLHNYQQICEKREYVKKWLMKNEQIAATDLACFVPNHLDYSLNAEKINDLLAYQSKDKKIQIFASRNDFTHLIAYKELFDDLYYKQKLYPEGLEKIGNDHRQQ